MLSHELDHFFFLESELKKYGLKGCSVFPRHLYDPVDLSRGKDPFFVFDQGLTFVVRHYRREIAIKTPVVLFVHHDDALHFTKQFLYLFKTVIKNFF